MPHFANRTEREHLRCTRHTCFVLGAAPGHGCFFCGAGSQGLDVKLYSSSPPSGLSGGRKTVLNFIALQAALNATVVRRDRSCARRSVAPSPHRGRGGRAHPYLNVPHPKGNSSSGVRSENEQGCDLRLSQAGGQRAHASPSQSSPLRPLRAKRIGRARRPFRGGSQVLAVHRVAVRLTTSGRLGIRARRTEFQRRSPCEVTAAVLGVDEAREIHPMRPMADLPNLTH